MDTAFGGAGETELLQPFQERHMPSPCSAAHLPPLPASRCACTGSSKRPLPDLPYHFPQHQHNARYFARKLFPALREKAKWDWDLGLVRMSSGGRRSPLPRASGNASCNNERSNGHIALWSVEWNLTEPDYA